MELDPLFELGLKALEFEILAKTRVVGLKNLENLAQTLKWLF
jgi:hypothetical protein